jgi:predicted DNA-binding protein
MKRTQIQLSDQEEERLEALQDLLGDDTIHFIRESEERRLAIQEVEAIYRAAADRNLPKGGR